MFSNTCRNVSSHRLHTQISVRGDDMSPNCEKAEKCWHMLLSLIFPSISKNTQYMASTLYAVSFNPESKVEGGGFVLVGTVSAVQT